MRAPDLFFLAVALLSAAAPAAGRQAPEPVAAEKSATLGDLELRMERELFVYPSVARRDPFASLARRTGSGPRFEDLTVVGIIHSSNAGTSVALIADGSGQTYRLRRGDSVGGARVLDISPTRVLFSVQSFGVVRQEQLEMKRRQEGTQR